jgi:hypothetical protein
MADGNDKAAKAAEAEGTLYVIERKVTTDVAVAASRIAPGDGDVWWSVGEWRHTRAGGAIYAWAEAAAKPGSTWDQAVPLGGDYRAIPKSRITQEPVEAAVQTVITVGKR